MRIQTRGNAIPLSECDDFRVHFLLRILFLIIFFFSPATQDSFLKAALVLAIEGDKLAKARILSKNVGRYLSCISTLAPWL